MGKSFGGLIAFNMCAKFPTLFKGMGLIVPFFHHYNETLYKYQPVVRLLNLFDFHFKLPSSSPTPSEEYRKKWAWVLTD